VAVGFAQDDQGDTLTLAEAETGGTWGLQSTPNPPGSTNAELDAVSCGSPVACLAVGDDYQNATGATLTLAEAWNGSTWSIEAMPTPGTPDSVLFGVSCPTAAWCMAVGEDGSGPLAEVWSGGSWTVVAPPLPSGATSASLAAVSCPTVGVCTAVGSFNATGNAQTLAEAWTGAGWTVEATPGQPGSATMLNGVACPTPTACEAVGSSENGQGTMTLAEAWNGVTWTSQNPGAPVPAADAPSLAAVSCSSPSNCAAVGQYTTNQLPAAFADAWNGVTWRLQPAPFPAGGVATLLSAVSCGAGCAAVGLQEGGSGVAVTMAVGDPGAAAVASDPTGSGYWSVNGAGVVTPGGAAPFLGDARALNLAQPVRAMAAPPDGRGYLLVAADGGVFTYGDAAYERSLPQLGVAVDNVVGVAETRDAKGYWMVGSDGGIFAFGDARFAGSLPELGVHVSDIVGMVAAPDGGGYLLVGADGGVFAFGSAAYHGSLPGLGVRVDDIVSIAPSASEHGYLLVGSDGGTFSLGTGAPYEGSLPGQGVAVGDVVGVALTPDGGGYWMAEATGPVWAFGDAST
jgi:hypothetical protein